MNLDNGKFCDTYVKISLSFEEMRWNIEIKAHEEKTISEKNESYYAVVVWKSFKKKPYY